MQECHICGGYAQYITIDEGWHLCADCVLVNEKRE